MKKLLALILSLLLLLMAGCGQGDSGSDAVGLYRCTGGADENGDDMSETLELLESLGMYITLELREDGTGVLDIQGDKTELTWSGRIIKMDGAKTLFTLEGDTLTMTEGKETLVFTRTSEEELTRMSNSSFDLDSLLNGNNEDKEPVQIAGVYYAVECWKEGEAAYVSDEYLRLENDGTGFFGILGDEYALEWTLNGSEFTFNDEEGDSFTGTFDGTIIEGDYFNGYSYKFELMEEPPEDFGFFTSIIQRLGNYQLTAIYSASEGDMTASLAYNDPILLELRSDGTGTMTASGEEAEITWDLDTISIEGETFPYVMEEGELILTGEGATMTFTKLG